MTTDTPLQLTWPQHKCVRCHKLTHEDGACTQCMADDTKAFLSMAKFFNPRLCVYIGRDSEELAKAQAQNVQWIMNELSRELGIPGA